MESTIYIQNLKCGGCAKTILNNLNNIESVENVTINHENNSISLSHQPEILEKIKQTLKNIGYPEEGENNNILDKAKSYVSCAVGKMS
jgi:copper chaperone